MVTSTSPTNGAGDVAVGSVITATFSEAMNCATLTTATHLYSVKPDGTDPVVLNASGSVYCTSF